MKTSRIIIILIIIAGMYGAYQILLKSKVSAAESTSPDILVDQVAAFGLSPDGKQVAYIDKQGLKTMVITGGKSRLLVKFRFLPEQWKTGADWPAYLGTNIAWSPDGKRIAVTAVSLAEKQSKLMIVDIISGNSRVTDHAAVYNALVWSYDSRCLAWIAYYAPIKFINGRYMTQNGSLGLLTGTPATSSHTIFRYPQMTSAHTYRLSWLPSDNIAFTLNGSQLGLVKSDGSHLQPIPVANKPETRYTGWMLSWMASPDGTQIAYSLARGFREQNGSLWTYRISDCHIAEVSDQYRPLDIAWSSDGRGLWFANARPGGGAPGMSFNPYPPNRLHWISTDGKRHRELPDEKDGVRGIQCAKTGKVFYISGDKLCAVQ